MLTLLIRQGISDKIVCEALIVNRAFLIEAQISVKHSPRITLISYHVVNLSKRHAVRQALPNIDYSHIRKNIPFRPRLCAILFRDPNIEFRIIDGH